MYCFVTGAVKSMNFTLDVNGAELDPEQLCVSFFSHAKQKDMFKLLRC